MLLMRFLFEDYVAGIAETSAASPMEFIKANMVAARTCASYMKIQISMTTRYFDVDLVRPVIENCILVIKARWLCQELFRRRKKRVV